MPEEMDVSCLLAKGLQPGEVEMPEDDRPAAAAANATPSIVPDPNIVDQLASMGFSIEGCKKAAFHTKNSGVEAAMNWVMEHMNDADFNDPWVDPNGPKSGGVAAAAFVPNEESLAMVMSMGFTMEQATKALKNTDGNVERAVEWIFSHPNDLDEQQPEADGASSSTSKKPLTNGSSKYKLMGFISHMGTSHLVGHYVCHILKDDKWVIFNDNKVALSEKPPKALGYLYFYKRI